RSARVQSRRPGQARGIRAGLLEKTSRRLTVEVRSMINPMQKLIICLAMVVLSLGAVGSKAADPKNDKSAAEEKKGYKNIAPEEFDKMRQKGTNVVLDVRTKKEYQEGH